jgi:hypothetical protein
VFEVVGREAALAGVLREAAHRRTLVHRQHGVA